MFLLDRFGVVRLWNQAADSITGLRANAVMGRRIGSIRTRRTEWAGPAFGLYISRELARRMNGRIGVTSTEGRARPSSASCRWPEAGTAAEVLAHISRSG